MKISNYIKDCSFVDRCCTTNQTFVHPFLFAIWLLCWLETHLRIKEYIKLNKFSYFGMLIGLDCFANFNVIIISFGFFYYWKDSIQQFNMVSTYLETSTNHALHITINERYQTLMPYLHTLFQRRLNYYSDNMATKMCHQNLC